MDTPTLATLNLVISTTMARRSLIPLNTPPVPHSHAGEERNGRVQSCAASHVLTKPAIAAGLFNGSSATGTSLAGG